MTADTGYSAKKAGYAQFQGGSHALQRPAVREEIRRIQIARLFNDALPLAVTTLITIMGDEKAAAGARVQASKVVLDRTLGSQEGVSSKSPHEMTPEEITSALSETRLRLAALDSVKADRARPIIEATPDIFE